MSWGERSCELYGNCRYNPTMRTCNVDCTSYLPNGKPPDSFPRTEPPQNEGSVHVTAANVQEIAKHVKRGELAFVKRNMAAVPIERVPHPEPGEPGRNAKCPCGSGRKFKKCCGG